MNTILNLTPRLGSIFSHWLVTPMSRSIGHMTMPNVSQGIFSACRLGNNEICINGLQSSGILGHQSIRTSARKFFSRPSEIKRINKHGWLKRMSTPNGRRVIMRRILKGRHCLTH